ncbi:MAG: hypothetical protein QG604_212 [Candidatus Dependentiae bacterium]|nr:hypothetical protein [Candidatus Dependentiae bacterium]
MNTKLITLSLLCVAISAMPEVPAVDTVASALHAELDRIDAECAKVTATATPVVGVSKSSGPAFVIKGARDLELIIEGAAKTEYVRTWNTATLNNAGAIDRAAAYNGNVELGTSVVYGKEKYGKAALKLFSRLRSQYQAGRFDKVLVTNPSTVKIVNAVLPVPGASLNATVPWLKHAGAELYLNSLFDHQIDTDHMLKIGLFEYELGRGIAYGSGYGTQKDYLGVYSGSQNFAPFGILFSGDMIKDRLAYEFYFARMEEKSADYKQTSAFTKTHIVGHRHDGRAGAENANDVFTGTLKTHYESERLGDLKSSIFIMYNSAIDQKIEMANDCQSKLITVGTNLEYEKGNFEIGLEIARNLGFEYVYNVDRNAVTLITGFPAEKHNVVAAYSKVTMNSAAYDELRDGAKAPVVSEFKTVVDGYDGNENLAVLNTTDLSSTSLPVYDVSGDAGDPVLLPSGAADYILKNSADRFRPAYKNTYAGWMGVLDASYNWKPANMKISVAAGYASGDSNPHARSSEYDKEYHGFVGINENYAGKRVKSVLALDARKLQTPLTAEAGDAQLFDNSFTDLAFVGAGVVWRLAKRDLECSANTLAFFKDKRSYTYVYNSVADTGGFGTAYARRFLGVELNSTFDWKLLPGLSLVGKAAIFLPGSFYTDVRGLPVDGSVIAISDETDDTGVTQSVGRLGTDPQVALNIALQYKF